MRLPTRLRLRRSDSHKGDYGHILIVAGSLRYSGAALLCAKAAMRAGAGLVTLAMPADVCKAAIKAKPDELMLLPLGQTGQASINSTAGRKILDFSQKTDVIAIGPGLSSDRSTGAMVRKLVRALRKPMVIDADGLNALAQRPPVALPPGTIITPHPGEMARLINIPCRVIEKKRKEVAKNFVARYNSTVVLKGARTVVAGPGSRIYVNTTGNPGMATAGSGDVLTGIIAAFRAQGLDAFEAAKYAVYLHGLAGDLAAKQKTQLGLIASDIIEFLPAAVKKSS